MGNYHYYQNKKAKSYKPLLRLLLAFFACLYTHSVLAQDLNIGVIVDYKYNVEQLNSLRQNISEEVSKTIGSSAQVVIAEDHIIFADYDPAVIQDGFARFTTQCDVVVLIGLKSTKTILNTNSITKPTIALGITNTDFQNIPLTAKGTSGLSNFSYILTSRSLEQELEQFYEVFPFKHLSLLFYQKAAAPEQKDKLEKEMARLSQRFNCTITPIVLGNSLASSLSEIPKNTDAAFLALTYEMTSEAIEDISNYLKSNKIASYSPLQNFVELGILMGVSSEKDGTSIYRKLGLMIDDIRNGKNAKDLAVTLGQKKQLFLNLETSRAIGFSPSFQNLFTANLVNGQDLANGQKYSLSAILEKAIVLNLGVQISYQDIALTEQELKEARSNYLPTVNVALQASQINEAATNELIGQSERSMTQTANASQLIYSEPAIANIKIQKLLNEAQKYATKQDINTAIFQTYQLYLNILFAKSNVNIQKENLEVLKKNLELAELQADIGAKNKSDVYRWTSEVANATQGLIEAQTGLIITKASLNTYLNNSLDQDYDIEDIDINSNLFDYYNKNFLVHQVKNPKDVRSVSRYLYTYASGNFPSVRELEYAIKALERQKKSNNRAFYLPDISLGLSQSEVLQRGGAASEPTNQLSNFVDSFWSVGLTLSYPLFEGNRKNINRQQTQIQTDQLNLQKTDLLNNLQLNIQSAIVNLLTAQTNIVLSEKSSENAQKNFDISQELYLESSISLVQFLDAQNASLNAKLNYINSIYSYVLAFAELENSIGFFSMLANTEDRQNFENSIKQSLKN